MKVDLIFKKISTLLWAGNGFIAFFHTYQIYCVLLNLDQHVRKIYFNFQSDCAPSRSIWNVYCVSEKNLWLVWMNASNAYNRSRVARKMCMNGESIRVRFPFFSFPKEIISNAARILLNNLCMNSTKSIGDAIEKINIATSGAGKILHRILTVDPLDWNWMNDFSRSGSSTSSALEYFFYHCLEYILSIWDENKLELGLMKLMLLLLARRPLSHKPTWR